MLGQSPALMSSPSPKHCCRDPMGRCCPCCPRAALTGQGLRCQPGWARRFLSSPTFQAVFLLPPFLSFISLGLKPEAKSCGAAAAQTLPQLARKLLRNSSRGRVSPCAGLCLLSFLAATAPGLSLPGQRPWQQPSFLSWQRCLPRTAPGIQDAAPGQGPLGALRAAGCVRAGTSGAAPPACCQGTAGASVPGLGGAESAWQRC